MPKYIKAEALIDDLRGLAEANKGTYHEEGFKNAITVVEMQDPADVVELEGSKVGKYLSYTTTGIPNANVRENVHAHWEIVYDEDCNYNGGGKYICGNCKHAFSFGAYFELCRFDYCPNCGAIMDERKDND